MMHGAQHREVEIKSLLKEELVKAAPLLKDHKVLLFGSRARGTAHSRSDFDIGILGKESLSLLAFYEIEDMLENLPTLYKIDLVDLNRVSQKFRDHALREAEVLYE